MFLIILISLQFKKGVFNLLNDDGIYVFEQPDFAIGALSLKFDQIYHEHVSYLHQEYQEYFETEQI